MIYDFSEINELILKFEDLIIELADTDLDDYPWAYDYIHRLSTVRNEISELLQLQLINLTNSEELNKSLSKFIEEKIENLKADTDTEILIKENIKLSLENHSLKFKLELGQFNDIGTIKESVFDKQKTFHKCPSCKENLELVTFIKGNDYYS
jgi:regulator of replication initiation timing